MRTIHISSTNPHAIKVISNAYSADSENSLLALLMKSVTRAKEENIFSQHLSANPLHLNFQPFVLVLFNINLYNIYIYILTNFPQILIYA